jgi:hypothetical protein
VDPPVGAGPAAEGEEGLAVTTFGVAFVPADWGEGDEATMLGVAFASVD